MAGVSVTLYLWGKNLDTHWIKGNLDPTANLDVFDRRKVPFSFPEPNQYFPTSQPLA
jgi:hypothetical protein